MPAYPSAHAPQTPANDPLGQRFAAIDAAAHASLATSAATIPIASAPSIAMWYTGAPVGVI